MIALGDTYHVLMMPYTVFLWKIWRTSQKNFNSILKGYNMIKKQKIKTHYYLDLTNDQMDQILTKDMNQEDSLFDHLYKIPGISDIDYGFGAGLWLSIEDKNDGPETWKQINEIIQGWLI